MKKICYVTTISSTIESFFIPQLKYLSENGFDVTVICSPDDGLQEELGDKICYIPVDIPRGVSVLGSIHATKNLLKIFKKENFDFIQYSTPNAALYSAIAAKVAKCSIRNYHLMGFRYLGADGLGRNILKSIERLTCILSTSIECVSKSNLELGTKEKIFSKDKATVVWNGSTGGVDLSKFSFEKRNIWRKEIREENNISDNEFVFGFVGRITKDKGINELLEAYFRLKQSSKLLIVGNQEGVDTINQRLWKKAVNDDNVIILDSKQEIEKYYAAMDILILPSYREGFGNVVIEAGAVGTPAIVTNIAGPIDAIEYSKTGITVEKCDFVDLAEKMQFVIDNSPFESSEYCSSYVRNHFDDMKLNEYILKRKQLLLND